jgi:hydroxyacylglutathione hydrolase
MSKIFGMSDQNWGVEQIYTACLSQGSYYIRSGKTAAVVDPLRETDPYIEMAERDGAEIKYIFETHFHADFVSGHLDLARKTGATIVYGPQATPAFEAYIAADGEEFEVGDLKIRTLHTPGHTLESTTWLLFDPAGKERAIFTGDTLFLGDVGRPDLAQGDADMDMKDLAGMLYDSLQNKIMTLPDEVVVYPGHGAGSACGKNMMKETVDTLGNQKKINYALKVRSREEFVEAVTDGLGAPPAYFPENVNLNKIGYSDLEKILEKSLRPLSPAEFVELAGRNCAVILDTRAPEDFCRGFIPSSINIGLNGRFAPWVGAVLENVKKPLLLVCEPGCEEEAIIRLARVGFDRILGFLDGGIERWKKSGRTMDSVVRVSPKDLAESIENGDQLELWDVRRPSEYHTLRIKGSLNKPLDFINLWSCRRTNGITAVVYCAGGYRSMIAASILKARGIHNFVEVGGGFNEIKKLNLEFEKSEEIGAESA